MTTQEIIEKLAFSQIGRPYIWGMQLPIDGFDCSGFIVWLFRQVRILPMDVDMTANDMWQSWERGAGDVGTCAFYGQIGRASHVMLVLSSNDALCIGASGDNDIVSVRPTHYRDDFLGFAAPRG